jgi:hypothetical protein
LASSLVLADRSAFRNSFAVADISASVGFCSPRHSRSTLLWRVSAQRDGEFCGSLSPRTGNTILFREDRALTLNVRGLPAPLSPFPATSPPCPAAVTRTSPDRAADRRSPL